MTQSQPGVNPVKNASQHNVIPFSEFIDSLKNKMKLVFHTRADVNQLSLKRGLPPFAMREIMSVNPLSVGIPQEYGGRGG